MITVNEDKMKDKDKIYIIECSYDNINFIIIDLDTFNYTIKANPTNNQNYWIALVPSIRSGDKIN